MNLFTRVKAAGRILFNKSTETIALNNLLDFLGLSDTKVDNLSEATYFACQKVLSETIGKLPFKLLQHNDRNGVTVARKHPLYRVVHDRPNPFMTATVFWSTIEFNRNHYGNAYAWIQGTGDKTKLWIMPSNKVEVWYDDAKILADQPDIYYLYSEGGKLYKFGSEEVLHFKTSNTLDGIVGVSVQDQLKMTIGSNYKAQKFMDKMYDTGFTGKAVLQYTGSLNDQNQKTFTKGIQKYIDGELTSEGIKNLIPLPFGATLQPLNLKLSESQYIEVKQYTALQIASAFGVKPYQIGDYTKSSYASAEAQQLSFLVDTLLYPLKQYEEETTYKLLTREDTDNGLYFNMNVSVILRADLQTQITSLSTAVNSFLYTPNEAREKLNLEAKEGGDELLGNGASIPVRYTGSQYVQSETVPTETENVEVDTSEIITIIDAIRSGKITYDQGVALLVEVIGFEDSTARTLLGDPEDYETPEEPEETPEETEDETPDDETSEEETSEENSDDETDETESE